MQSVGNTVSIPHYTKTEFEAVSTRTTVSTTADNDPTDHYVESVRASLKSLFDDMVRKGLESLPYRRDDDSPVNAALALATHYKLPIGGMSAAMFALKLDENRCVTPEELGQLGRALSMIPVESQATDAMPLSEESKSPNPLRSFM